MVVVDPTHQFLSLQIQTPQHNALNKLVALILVGDIEGFGDKGFDETGEGHIGRDQHLLQGDGFVGAPEELVEALGQDNVPCLAIVEFPCVLHIVD